MALRDQQARGLQYWVTAGAQMEAVFPGVTDNVDYDRAYRDLGEAVWAEVSKGKLQLPPNLSTVRKSLEAVTQKIRAQNASRSRA